MSNHRVKFVSRLTLIQTLMTVFLLYLLFMTLQVPLVFKTALLYASDGSLSDALPRPLYMADSVRVDPRRIMRETREVSGFFFNDTVFDAIGTATDEFSLLHKAARQALVVGKKLWEEVESGKIRPDLNKGNTTEQKCPNSIVLSESEFGARKWIMELPCGLTLGSHITVVGKPRWAHPERDPKIALVKEGEEAVMVTQFMMELQGLKTVDGEDPPRILHFNPRLKGDWSGKPVIEQNTCYRMQWGNALRCEGWSSRADEETGVSFFGFCFCMHARVVNVILQVDGLVKCEKWLRDDDSNSEDSKATWWLNRLIGWKKKMSYNWPYPFVEGKLFVLTLSAGLEGYHINVDGRHITSFPYRTGFVLEDATGLYLNGDVDVQSVFAASLPASHPSFAPQQHLEMFKKWQAPPLPNGQAELFIGVLSAGNHFAERMAVRKTWMQHELIRSSKIVARFFVALNGRKEINVDLKKEAEYFGDIVIVPYMDNYDLVVLKTVAICEYGVRIVDAKYIMKCDDDTFVRVDVMIKEAKKVQGDGSLYIGNINYYHKPLRNGKWAVTYEEWPEEEYPPYANGPGYIISCDIAGFIVAEFESHKLRLFKMEDVSMGMWVEKFNTTKTVEYIHSLKFCQFGCIEDYYTAHYQSPRQMICLWDKLNQGKSQCCNMR